MHGYYKKDSQMELRKMSQKVLDDYQAVLGRIKRHQERLDVSMDEKALLEGLFPELVGPEDKIGGTSNEDDFDEDIELDEDASGSRGDR